MLSGLSVVFFFVKLAVFEVWSLLAFWLLRVYRSMLV